MSPTVCGLEGLDRTRECLAGDGEQAIKPRLDRGVADAAGERANDNAHRDNADKGVASPASPAADPGEPAVQVVAFVGSGSKIGLGIAQVCFQRRLRPAPTPPESYIRERRTMTRMDL